ncbi:MAG: S8 family peptidase, partial [Acidobacteriota bacterium]
MKLLHAPRTRHFALAATLLLSHPLAKASTFPADGQTARISASLARQLEPASSDSAPEDLFSVLIRVSPDEFDRFLQRRLQSGQKAGNALPLIHSFKAQLSADEIRQLMRSDQVEYVTLDAPLHSFSWPDDFSAPALDQYLATVGADNFWRRPGGATVAVFDSGIALHPDLPQGKVMAAVDFTSEAPQLSQRNSDEYGHGTHVAGIIGGEGLASARQQGVQPGNRFVDLKVIDAEGRGQTSNLIRAIEWVIENKDRYHIAVANLSLGHPSLESYQDDPLCQAVRQMVLAGIVTVVSAGNLGKTDEYPEIWGGIASPGQEPSVITVSALNTRGTLTHQDDIATSYSSRGPSRDGGFKPDLTAPGNAIPSALASGSLLGELYPELKVDSNYISLSGSSMATAFVSGVAAGMLSANPDLNPWQVKLVLLMTAAKLESPHLFE